MAVCLCEFVDDTMMWQMFENVYFILVIFRCYSLWSADDDGADEEEDHEIQVVNDASVSSWTQESEEFKTSPVKQSPILTSVSQPVEDSASQLTVAPSPAQTVDSSSTQNTLLSTSTTVQTKSTSMSQNISSVTPTPTDPSAPEKTATEVNQYNTTNSSNTLKQI